MTQLVDTDPSLDIFVKLYFHMLERATPWIVVKIDDEIYYLSDLYDLLKRRSINDPIKDIMKAWGDWAENYLHYADDNAEIPIEIMSFEDPMIEIFHQLSQNIRNSGDPWTRIEYQGSILALPDIFDQIDDKSINLDISFTMNEWHNLVQSSGTAN